MRPPGLQNVFLEVPNNTPPTPNCSFRCKDRLWGQQYATGLLFIVFPFAKLLCYSDMTQKQQTRGLEHFNTLELPIRVQSLNNHLLFYTQGFWKIS